MKITNSTRATRKPAFWEYPPLPHDYPYYWFLSDSVKTRQSYKLKKNMPKIQIFEFYKKTLHNTPSEVAWHV